MDFRNLAKEYGTPLFVYDCDGISERADYFHTLFPNVEICFAIKANSFVLKEIADKVDRFEVCSNGEYEICKKLNISDKKIVLSGVNKEEAYFDQIIKENRDILRFTVESITQFEMLKKLANKYQKTIQIMPRLTSGNQFGITAEEVDYILANRSQYTEVVGLEFFSGTQKHSIKRIGREFEKVNTLLNELEAKYDFKFAEVEYGTGFPIYYFQGDDFDEKAFFEEFKEVLNQYFADRKMIFEIGRSLVANYGVYLTSVADLKENSTGKYVILDGGINHLTYYGQSMAMKVPYYQLLQDNPSDSEEVVNLCGSLCTVNDLIVKQLSCPKLSIGDLFVFENVGAYSATEGLNLFLSRELPKVVLKSNDKYLLVREDTNTYLKNCPIY